VKLPARAPPPVVPVFAVPAKAGASPASGASSSSSTAPSASSTTASAGFVGPARQAIAGAASRVGASVGSLVNLDAFDDTYENHEPKPLPVAAQTDKLLDRAAPMRTHERVIHDVGGSFFGVSVAITVSQLDLVRKNTHGVEVIQVVNPDGSSNIETVLGRLQLGHNQRIELQGPALNSSLTPGDLPVGARFIGLGLTSDVTSAMDHDALSYTVEVKLTQKSVAELAALVVPGAADIAANALADVAGSAVSAVVADAVLGAVPVLSATLAVASARRAVHVCTDETASKEMKAFAVAHAVADTVRIVEPLTGTLMNAGLVGVAALCGWVHVRHAKHAPPVGPPDGGTGSGGGGGLPLSTPT
jgi:hypothetical protein